MWKELDDWNEQSFDFQKDFYIHSFQNFYWDAPIQDTNLYKKFKNNSYIEPIFGKVLHTFPAELPAIKFPEINVTKKRWNDIISFLLTIEFEFKKWRPVLSTWGLVRKYNPEDRKVE